MAVYRIIRNEDGHYGIVGDTDMLCSVFTTYREISIFVYFLNKFDVEEPCVPGMLKEYFECFGFLEQLRE